MGLFSDRKPKLIEQFAVRWSDGEQWFEHQCSRYEGLGGTSPEEFIEILKEQHPGCPVERIPWDQRDPGLAAFIRGCRS